MQVVPRNGLLNKYTNRCSANAKLFTAQNVPDKIFVAVSFTGRIMRSVARAIAPYGFA
jgi:hypothetical protein